MNEATLTTTSGYTWTTSINGSFKEVRKYFLGKFFPVGSFDENAPGEGFTNERVVKLKYTNERSGKITVGEIEPEIDFRHRWNDPFDRSF